MCSGRVSVASTGCTWLCCRFICTSIGPWQKRNWKVDRLLYHVCRHGLIIIILSIDQEYHIMIYLQKLHFLWVLGIKVYNSACSLDDQNGDDKNKFSSADVQNLFDLLCYHKEQPDDCIQPVWETKERNKDLIFKIFHFIWINFLHYNLIGNNICIIWI